jgi:uncharacterized membrane protein YidH (DUF202 family)
MTSDATKPIQQGDTPARLQISLLSGFVAFACQLSLHYVLRGHACHTQSPGLLYAITGCALLLTVVGGLLGFGILRALPADKHEEGGKPHDRAHFQALLAVGFNISFGVAIVALAIPAFLLPTC